MRSFEDKNKELSVPGNPEKVPRGGLGACSGHSLHPSVKIHFAPLFYSRIVILLFYPLPTMSCGFSQDKLSQLLEKCCEGGVRNIVLYNEHFYEGLSATAPCFLWSAKLSPRFLFAMS